MPFALANTNSVAHNYDSDDGETYFLPLREVYTVASGLPVASGSHQDWQQGWKARGFYIGAVVNNKLKRRFVACSQSKADTLVTGAVFGNIDGVNWTVLSYRGEKRRTKRLPAMANQ